MNEEEWFDVVDEHDCVIDRRKRSEVHREGLRHRAVHILVFRSDGLLLIHLRSDTKDEFPGVWTSSAAGHVSAGETYADTAPRELQEELGIQCPLQYLHKFDACPETSMEFTELYRGTWDGDLSPDPGEIQRVEWIRLQELNHRVADRPADFSPAFRLQFDWYLSQYGSGI